MSNISSVSRFQRAFYDFCGDPKFRAFFPKRDQERVREAISSKHLDVDTIKSLHALLQLDEPVSILLDLGLLKANKPERVLQKEKKLKRYAAMRRRNELSIRKWRGE